MGVISSFLPKVTSPLYGRYAAGVQKRVSYPMVHFDGATVRRALSEMERVARELFVAANGEEAPTYSSFFPEPGTASVSRGNETWQLDSLEEFLADYVAGRSDSGFRSATLSVSSNPGGLWGDQVELWLFQEGHTATIDVKAATRPAIEAVHAVFSDAAPSLQTPVEVQPTVRPRIFVGHGGASTAWRELADHLRDQHGLDVVAYETGSRAGHSIRDILDEMMDSASFAILVMTGEDEQPAGTLRARQNVVHEAGLFQGRLGFSRAVIVREEGVEMLSNLDGIQYVGFAHHVRETYGELLSAVRREFGAF